MIHTKKDEDAGAKPLTDTDKQLQAVGEAAGREVAEQILSERTAESSENFEKIAESKVKEGLQEHTLECMKPGGGLWLLSEKTDKMTRTVTMATGAVALLLVLVPIFGAFISHKMQIIDDLQIQVAKMTGAVEHLRAQVTVRMPTNQPLGANP